jgi:xanthine dehydrogenase YagR molybdenum-binding subunit
MSDTGMTGWFSNLGLGGAAGGASNALTMDKPHPTSLLDSGAQGLIGRPLPRYEGPLKVAGRATYAAEYGADNMAYGVLVGATIGAGKIVSIDADAVRALPGVIDVVTDYDTFIQAPQQGGETKAPVQGVKTITYFGEIVAIVLAETFEAARDAARQLRIAYKQTDGRYDFEAHRRETEKPPNDNIPSHSQQGDVDAALAQARFTVDATFTTPSQNSAAMEPHASLAMWDDDGALTLYGSYQMPTSDAQQLAKALGVSASKVRIISPYVGGGFGAKLGIAPESVAAAIAAKRLGRPVKAVMHRQQVFEATVRRSNTEQRVRLGADADGALTAIAHETLVSNLDGQDYFEPTGIATHFLYSGKNRRISHDLVRLNLLLSGSMRAPGEAVGMLALEGAMDELAEAIGIDPVELRRRNDPDADPEKDIPYSSRALTRCLDEGARMFGWATRAKRRDGEWLIGTGMASAARSNMLQKSSARVTIRSDGTATVESAMTDIGTGSYTILAQIAGELLGLPLDRIEVKLGDTDLPSAAGSGGSWGAASAGSAVYLACETLRDRLAGAMGVDADAMTLKDGKVIADNRVVDLGSLVGDGLSATGEISPGKQEKHYTQASYGAHFCEVAVNATTGEVRVRRMLGVFAAGRILNEQTARSQCLGGMTFGIGGALHEDLVHDIRTGKLVNHDLAEYHVPVNADVPQIEVHFLAERDVHANPIHAKGIGELGIAGAGAAVANAIYDACGVRVRDFPITLDKIIAGLPPM